MRHAIWAPFRMFALLALLIVLPAAQAAGVFHYERSFSASGGYGDLNVSLTDARALWVEPGRLYVSDPGAQAVWVLNGSDAVVERIPSSHSSLLNRPFGLMRDGSTLYVADEGLGQAVAYLGSSSYLALGPAVSARRLPRAVWAENSTLWLIDTQLDQMLEYNMQTGRNTRALFSQGVGGERLSEPNDLYADEHRFYIADSGNNRVQVYDRDWRYLDSFGTGRGGVSLMHPSSASSDGSRVYVADTDNRRIVVFSPDGYPLETMSDGAGGPWPITPRSVRVLDGRMYVLDANTMSVLAYSLNWSVGVPQVLADLDALNRSISQHQLEVIDVMDRIGMSRSPFEAPASLSLAFDFAHSGQYVEASSKLADARRQLDAVRLQQRQALRTELQKRIDGFWALLEPYRARTLSQELAYQRTVIQNRVQTAQERLNRDEYGSAADLELAIATDVDAWRTQADAWLLAQSGASNQTVSAPGPSDTPQKAALKAQAAALSARLALMQVQASTLGQNGTGEALALLVESGARLADTGSYEQANATLRSASSRLDDWQTQLDALARRQDNQLNASATLDYASELLNQSQAVLAAAGVDSKPYAAKLESARSYLANSPDQARAMALEVIESIKMEQASLSSRSSAFGWVGLIIGAVVLVGLGAWLLFRNRLRRGL